LHHANIDRIWEEWLRRGNSNPTDSSWLSARWTFGTGGQGSTTRTEMTTAEVLDPRRPPLGYRYSDMPVTPSGEVFPDRFAEARPPMGEQERPPELVGATSGPVPIGTTTTSARVDVSTPTGPIARLIDESGTVPLGSRVFLRLENITATKVGAGSVLVHVNVPPGGRPADFPDRKAGLLPMFGVLESSKKDDKHSGSGQSRTFEITRIVRAQSAAGQWDPKKLQITFTPLPDASGAVPSGDVTVGRVSLFYA